MTVASSTANEWNPAIAASSTGEVTIAWDSYRKGDYDVYFRTYDKDARAGDEKAADSSARYASYPSIAYDPSGRLWVAWEESGTHWGKDFGADETTGIGLYHGRLIKIKVWQGDRVFNPPEVGKVLSVATTTMVTGASTPGGLLKSKLTCSTCEAYSHLCSAMNAASSIRKGTAM